ncbi:hypothetical protein M885DRAFT_617350 [Pelagophyceae sp. CCMP2097]|nr:hypothetical protein M885DRAFT_617350 [Pelagophyceae sp. CCMP2097]
MRTFVLALLCRRARGFARGATRLSAMPAGVEALAGQEPIPLGKAPQPAAVAAAMPAELESGAPVPLVEPLVEAPQPAAAAMPAESGAPVALAEPLGEAPQPAAAAMPAELESGAPVPLAEAGAANGTKAGAANRTAVGVDMFGEPVYEDDMARDAAAADAISDAELEAMAVAEGRGANWWAEASAADDDDAPVEEAEEAAVYDLDGSEWKVGILWNGKKKIDVTWIRCNPGGVARWGLPAEGKWKVEDGNYATFSRDFFGGWNGKRLLSARLQGDGNYLSGYVRGWKPWDTASVLGQFQAIRLGVDRSAEDAPWLAEQPEPAAGAAKLEGDELWPSTLGPKPEGNEKWPSTMGKDQ